MKKVVNVVNKVLVRATSLSLLMMAFKVSAVFLVPLVLLARTHFKELTRW
ncbi:hypothetical protein NF212_15125 [Parasalinivibrio latis]